MLKPSSSISSSSSSSILRQRTFEYSVDYKRVFSLFYKDAETADKSKEESSSSSSSSRTKPKGILDARSSQNVEICLKKHKLAAAAEFEGLAQQLQQLQQLNIDTTLAQNLVLYWPEAEAIEEYKSKTKEQILSMPAADQLFFCLLNNVPLCCDRLKFFLEYF